MRVLVLNAGSSSIKFRLLAGRDLDEVAAGVVERIGSNDGHLALRWASASAGATQQHEEAVAVANHAAGLAQILDALTSRVPGGGHFDVVAHRVVHGGEHYRDAVLVDEAVIDRLRALTPLAPLHNPANVTGIEVALALRPDVPQVAVFDTAYHQTMPARAYRYAVPRRWYERHHVRRYGFHGTSVRYVTHRAAQLLGKPVEDTSLVVLHLGNGASATAVQRGRSIDTSMGMTPLEGLVMGTRSGDLDPSVPHYVTSAAGMDARAVDHALNHESGLKALAGVSDMRDVLERRLAGASHAEEAVDVYCYRIRKYVGAYLAALGRADAVVFTGGVGENQPAVRAQSLTGLELFGLRVDPERNRRVVGVEGAIGTADGDLDILVVPTNEERQIAREALAVRGVDTAADP